MIGIEGLEMPKECYRCPLLDGEYGTCNIIGETKVDMTEKRASNCPLVEIHEPKPMQVELEGDGYSDGELVYDYGKCPICGWDFEYGDKDWEEPYCCHCGQRLKWFESEEEK